MDEKPTVGKIIWGIICLIILTGFILLSTESVLWTIAIVGGAVFLFWLYIALPKMITDGKASKEVFRVASEERAELLKQQKEEAYAQRLRLRSDIEKMPKYENWRRAVFEKCGRQCEMCGSITNLQVHHRDSFDLIIRAFQIDTLEKAFECNALWNVNNGSVLCPECHSKMKSSKYRQKNL